MENPAPVKKPGLILFFLEHILAYAAQRADVIVGQFLEGNITVINITANRAYIFCFHFFFLLSLEHILAYAADRTDIVVRQFPERNLSVVNISTD